MQSYDLDFPEPTVPTLWIREILAQSKTLVALWHGGPGQALVLDIEAVHVK